MQECTVLLHKLRRLVGPCPGSGEAFMNFHALGATGVLRETTQSRSHDPTEQPAR
jgi:hypothetical protein